MSIIKGIDGACKVNGTTVPVKSWEYSPIINQSEITNVGEADQSFLSTTRGGNGSMVLNFDPTDASQKVIVDKFLTTNLVTNIWLMLYTDSSAEDGFQFSALVTGISLPVGANDVDELTVNFLKTGATFQVPTT